MKRDRVFKIHFYKIDAGTDLNNQPILYNVKSTLEAIHNLDFHTYERYLKDEDDVDFCCWIDDFSCPQKVRFYKIRRDVQALIELNGNLSELTMPDKAGLAECVHLIFFPDNIVGIEYNYEGPRVEAISDYLYLKSKKINPHMPEFEHLLEENVLEKIDKMQILRIFRLKIRPSLFSSLQKANQSFAQSLQTTIELGHAQEVEIILSVGRGKGSLNRGLLNIAKDLFALKDTNNDVLLGKIKGRNDKGKPEEIDLLNAKIVVEATIRNYKDYTTGDMSALIYTAIEKAYTDRQDQLKKALGVTVCPV